MALKPQMEDTVSSDLLKARNEFEELRAQNDTLTNIKQCQQEEIARLKRVSHVFSLILS